MPTPVRPIISRVTMELPAVQGGRRRLVVEQADDGMIVVTGQWQHPQSPTGKAHWTDVDHMAFLSGDEDKA